jgi:hypothetical protein
LAVVEYPYEKRPESIKELVEAEEDDEESSWLPLHSAAARGSLEIIEFLMNVYPEAATLEQNLPLLFLLMTMSMQSC